MFCIGKWSFKGAVVLLQLVPMLLENYQALSPELEITKKLWVQPYDRDLFTSLERRQYSLRYSKTTSGL